MAAKNRLPFVKGAVFVPQGVTAGEITDVLGAAEPELGGFADEIGNFFNAGADTSAPAAADLFSAAEDAGTPLEVYGSGSGSGIEEGTGAGGLNSEFGNAVPEAPILTETPAGPVLPEAPILTETPAGPVLPDLTNVNVGNAGSTTGLLSKVAQVGTDLGTVTADTGKTILSKVGSLTSDLEGLAASNALRNVGILTGGVGVFAIGADLVINKASAAPAGGDTPTNGPGAQATGLCAANLANGNLDQAGYTQCLACEKSLKIGDDPKISADDQTALQSCIKAATNTKNTCGATSTGCTTNPSNGAPNPGKTTTQTNPAGNGQTSQSAVGPCQNSFPSDPTSLAHCKQCEAQLNVTDDPNMSAANLTALKSCLSAAGVTPTPSPTPSSNAQDACDYLLAQGTISQAIYPICKSCETSSGISDTTTKMSSSDAQKLVTCISQQSGTPGSTTAGASSQDQQTMASDVASGQNPCSDPSLAPATATACKACYTAGMSATDLVTCVNGKLAATGTPTAGVVGTLQKYALPLAVGGVIIVVGLVATHGSLWGKKGGKGKIPPRNPPQRAKMAENRH